MRLAAPLLEVAGVILVVAGVALLSVPAALILAGVFLVLTANANASGEADVRPISRAGNRRRAA